jgi:hypothetical protein
MKYRSSAAIAPAIVALGACSNSNSGTPVTLRDGGLADALSIDGAALVDGGDAAASGDDSSSATEFDATLASAQVIPNTGSGAAGTAKFFLQADGQTLTYSVMQNVANAQSVNLHVGAPGENGAVTHQLTPVSGQMMGSVSLTMAEQAALAVDQLYVDVTSATFPTGEIRGQITPPGATIFVAVPTGAQQVPPVMTSLTAHASFILSQDQATAIFHVVTTAVPTNVVLVRGIGGTNGQIAFPLAPLGLTMDGTLQLGANDPQDLIAGRFYVNIQTAANPAGELRGQIIPPGATLFTGVLLGANEVPPVTSSATGGAQCILSADQQTLTYEAVVNGIIPTAIEIDQAPKGQNGPMLNALTLDQQGAAGQLTMTPTGVVALMGGAAYINVRTASNANGELRTQLTRQ